MTDEDKAPFVDQQREDRERYDQELDAFRDDDPDGYAELLASRKRGKKKGGSKEGRSKEGGEAKAKQIKPSKVEIDLKSDDLITRTMAEIRMAGRKKKTERTLEELKEMAGFFCQKMLRAHMNDRICQSKGKVALYKMRMLEEVDLEVRKVGVQEMLMEFGLLQMLNLWLHPTKGILPNRKLRNTVYELLQILPVDEQSLEASRVRDFVVENGEAVESNKEVGLGQILDWISKNKQENTQTRSEIQRMIQRWSRPMLGLSTDYRKLSEIEVANARKILWRKRQIPDKPLYPRPPSKTTHVSCPQADVFDFAIRPQPSIDFEAIQRKNNPVKGPEAFDTKALIRKMMAKTLKAPQFQAFMVDRNGRTIIG